MDGKALGIPVVKTDANSSGGTITYQWSYENINYKLDYSYTRSGPIRWILYKENIETIYTDLPKETNTNSEGDLIKQNHIREEYSDYTIDEDYTNKEEFKYIIKEHTYSKSNKYDLDLSEIDCWFLKYDRQYNNPTLETQTNSMNTNTQGQFPQEFEILVDNTNDETQIRNDSEVQAFISARKQQYQTDYPEAENIECKVNNLTVKQKTKTDASVEYSSTKKTYSFGEEEADTTDVRLKNIEYINGQPSYTLKDENGNEEVSFLSIYKTYRQNGVDLYLENDSEKKLFNLLESNSQTVGISDTMRYLLYVCDGLDRGVTNLTIKIIDIESMNKVKGSSTENFIKAWENSELWKYEIGESSVLPTKYLSEDEFCYIVYEDGSRGHNNIAYGISTFISSSTNVQVNHPEYGNGYYNDCKALFEAQGVSVENLHEGAYVEKAIADSVFSTFLKDNFIDEVDLYLDTNLPEYSFSKAQKNALVAVMWQRGNLGNFATAYVESLNEDGTINTEKIKENFVVNDVQVFNYTNTVEDRMYANWLLFTEGTYIDRAGDIIPVGSGSIVEAAYEVADHYNNSGVDVHYAGSSVPEATSNGIIVPGTIQASWDLPIEQPDKYGIVCATFVSLAIWQAELIDETTINQYNYHSCIGVDQLLTTSEYADEWEVINNWDELQEGDIVYMEGHVFIFMEGEKCLDQAYCVLPSNYKKTGYDSRGNLINAANYRSKFIKGYRYIG